MLGDSLLNHIAEPEGWIISNEAGATLSRTDHLIKKASQRLGTQLKPDCLLIQLGTNDLTYNKLSATEIITKYTDIIVNVKNRHTDFVIAGDMNARTGEYLDYVSHDEQHYAPLPNDYHADDDLPNRTPKRL